MLFLLLAALDHLVSISETGNFLKLFKGAFESLVFKEILASAVNSELLGICLSISTDLDDLRGDRVVKLGTFGRCLPIEKFCFISRSQLSLAVQDPVGFVDGCHYTGILGIQLANGPLVAAVCALAVATLIVIDQFAAAVPIFYFLDTHQKIQDDRCM